MTTSAQESSTVSGRPVTRRSVLGGALAGSTALALPWSISNASEPTPPNLIVILVPGLGARDPGSTGSSFHETPHLDALVGSGVTFGHAYAAAPTGTPSRASLLTGKYPATLRLTSEIGPPVSGPTAEVPSFDRLPAAEMTYARVLRNAGYATWHVGLWGLGPSSAYPHRHGFDINRGGFSEVEPKSHFSPYGIPTLTDRPGGEYLTDELTAAALTLIDGAGSTPFCLNLWHYAPSGRLQAPSALVAKYEAKARRLGLDPSPIDIGEHFRTWHQRARREHHRRYQSQATYAAMLETVDASVGQLVAALDRRGLRDNTLVLVTSDRGGVSTADGPEGAVTSNAPLRGGAGWLTEGGLRVPLIVSWPAGGLVGGRTVAGPVTSPDIFPTLVRAAGLAIPERQPVDGMSLLGAGRGEPIERDAIFWHHPHWATHGGRPGSGVRLGRLKLVQHLDNEETEVFDVVADPGEARNLMHGPDQKDQIRAMRRRLHDWRNSVGATAPRPTPWPPFEDLPSGEV